MTASLLLPNQEDGGPTNEDTLELLESAVRRGGGTVGEQQAVRTYWRQRNAVANARGVAICQSDRRAHYQVPSARGALATPTTPLLTPTRIPLPTYLGDCGEGMSTIERRPARAGDGVI